MLDDIPMEWDYNSRREALGARLLYQKAYGVIFDSVVELFNEGKPVDLITLQNRLREKAVRKRSVVLNLSDLVTVFNPQQQSTMPRSSLKSNVEASDQDEWKRLRMNVIRDRSFGGDP